MGSNSHTISNISNTANNSRCHRRYLPSPNTKLATSLLGNHHHHSRPVLAKPGPNRLHNLNLIKVHRNG